MTPFPETCAAYTAAFRAENGYPPILKPHPEGVIIHTEFGTTGFVWDRAGLAQITAQLLDRPKRRPRSKRATA